MATYTKEFRYACCECGELFENEFDAVDCCPTPAECVDVFVCNECDFAHLEEADAIGCCPDTEE